MGWRPPWQLGLPQEECSSCGLRCVAQTLDASGRCRHCVVQKRLAAVVEAEPEPLFDPDRAA